MYLFRKDKIKKKKSNDITSVKTDNSGIIKILEYTTYYYYYY